MKAVRTRIGWADFGDYEHFGLRLHRDLVGRIGYLGITVFGVTGRTLEGDELGILEDVAVCAHVPEPRVWPLKLARLVASSGRPIAGYLAASFVLDGDFIGGDSVARSAVTLSEVADALRAAGDPSDPGARRAIITRYVRERDPWPGVGVQQRAVDERVTGIRRCLAQRGLASRPWWTLSEDLWSVLQAERGLGANVFEAIGAVGLDVGLTPAQIGALTTALLQPQFLAHAVEGAEQRAEELRRLPPEAVHFTGHAPRRSPRAAATGEPDR